MKRDVIVGLSAVLLASVASLAQAHTDVVFSVGLGNAQPVYVQSQPVYVQPRPVFVPPQPAYVQPQPVYLQSRGYYDSYGRWVRVSRPAIHVRSAPVYGDGYEFSLRVREEREWRRAEWRRSHWRHDRDEFDGERHWD